MRNLFSLTVTVPNRPADPACGLSRREVRPEPSFDFL
jgi:hypothetical protein